MMRLRFSSGLTLGLALGLPTGALLALLLTPSRPAEPNGATALQVQELTRKLEAAKEARDRADGQLEQFQKLAEQMTTSFQSLEARFKALEAEQATPRAAAPPTATKPPPSAPPPPTPTVPLPEAAEPPAADAAP